MTIVKNSCMTCDHYFLERACFAFPQKIPESIWGGKNDHKKQVKGDNGIKYKRIIFSDNQPRKLADSR